jgi:hypothetical protein
MGKPPFFRDKDQNPDEDRQAEDVLDLPAGPPYARRSPSFA